MNISEEKLEELISKAVAAGVETALKNFLPYILYHGEHSAQCLWDKLQAELDKPDWPFYLPYNVLRQRAACESADFIRDNMSSAVLFKNKLQLIHYALQHVTLDGYFLEFGVASGTSINMIASLMQDKTIFGFDSFEGLPEDWNGHAEVKGAFTNEGVLPKVEKNVVLIKGLFSDTLPHFFKGNNKPIAFLHCDADIYSSTKCIFAYCKERIVSGTVILFDEFFNYPNWRQHEYKAFMELVEEKQLRYHYLGSSMFQVAVMIE